MDNNAANEGVISRASNRVAARATRTDDELTIARAASRTLGHYEANKEIHTDQGRKCVFRFVPNSTRGPPID